MGVEILCRNRDGGDSLKWRRYAGRDILPLWVADTDFAAAPAIVEAVQRRAAEGVYGYAEPTEKLTETICAYFARRWEWKISPKWIVFSPGLGPALHNIARMVKAEGGAMITPRPVYHVFRNAPAIAGAKRRDAAMVLGEDGKWLWPESAWRGEKDGARVLNLCNPNNPNGKVYSQEELRAIVKFCRDENLILCAGEVHADLILEKNLQHHCAGILSEQIGARTIVLQSPSKAFNIAGCNFAVAVIADDKLREEYVAAGQGKILSHLNPFGMAAAQAAWSGACDDWLESAADALRARRDFLSAAVEKIDGITMPPLPATYLAWLDVSRLKLDDAPAHFEAHGLGMSPGESFGDADFMRLNFGCSMEMLEDATRRLQKAAASALI